MKKKKFRGFSQFLIKHKKIGHIGSAVLLDTNRQASKVYI